MNNYLSRREFWKNIQWALFYLMNSIGYNLSLIHISEPTRQAENGSENGWIVPKGKINVDDQIVTNGAQLLLSEEFKYQIKNENED